MLIDAVPVVAGGEIVLPPISAHSTLPRGRCHPIRTGLRPQLREVGQRPAAHGAVEKLAGCDEHEVGERRRGEVVRRAAGVLLDGECNVRGCAAEAFNQRLLAASSPPKVT